MTSSPVRADRVVAVAVPVPGLGLLSYRASSPLHKGARVRVPLGTRAVIGVVVDDDTADPGGAALKDIAEVIDQESFVPSAVVDLAKWVGEYYASGPGGALALAMPLAARQGEKDSFRKTRVVELSGEPSATLRSDKQRAALAEVRSRGGRATMAELKAAGVTSALVQALARAGLVRVIEEVTLRDPFAAGSESPAWTLGAGTTVPPALTPEQAHAFRHLEEAAAAGTFRTVLLHGVTGSGKTELYLRLARQVIDRGGRVLMLVPEISLTPAVAGLLRGRFGERVAIQHSALSDGERHDQWHRIRRGDVDIVIGTRSAVFAPLERLALVIVDEEHDGSYKQDESPRYHGRDVAIVRARNEHALVVLGSATPSLETAFNAEAGRYDRVVLTKRVLDRRLADVQIVDMRREYAEEGPDVTLSRPLLAALADRLGKGEQSLVLLNRRGFATVIFCRECGASLECPHCSVSLTFHRTQRRVRCHYCNYASQVPAKCGACGGQYLEQSGFGTERLESDLLASFPGARVVRVDRDTVRRRGAIAGVLQAVARGDVDIVVGTQMIAKGHDFPSVTLVGVVSADVGLGVADFRAAERTFQLLTQVAGRAGRGQVPGQAIVQTLCPGHYAVRAAAAQDYASFYAHEIEFRTSLKYPPAVALINVIVKARSSEGAMADAHDLVVRTRRYHPHGHVVGPAPAVLSRLKDEYRAQFFIKGKQRPAMREALLRALDERPELKRRVIVDVDPLNVL